MNLDQLKILTLFEFDNLMISDNMRLDKETISLGLIDVVRRVNLSSIYTIIPDDSFTYFNIYMIKNKIGDLRGTYPSNEEIKFYCNLWLERINTQSGSCIKLVNLWETIENYCKCNGSFIDRLNP